MANFHCYLPKKSTTVLFPWTTQRWTCVIIIIGEQAKACGLSDVSGFYANVWRTVWCCSMALSAPPHIIAQEQKERIKPGEQATSLPLFSPLSITHTEQHVWVCLWASTSDKNSSWIKIWMLLVHCSLLKTHVQAANEIIPIEKNITKCTFSLWKKMNWKKLFLKQKEEVRFLNFSN